jgi:aspartate/methionine/tyrosine aminotransferase
MPTCAADFRDLISAKAKGIDVSGIRRVFELGAKLPDPINLSIGQPDFPVDEAIKEAAIAAIRADVNGYTLTQGLPALRDAIGRHLLEDVGWSMDSEDLGLLVTSGTSGAMLLACMSLLDAGDEIIVPDPYFVIYPAHATLAGATPVFCDTHPDFRMTAERVEPLISDRTKMLIVNSPSNPSGVVLTGRELAELVELCERRGVLIISDEIYDEFTYADAREDGRCPSPARVTGRMLLVRGFGKTYGCTGWRMGYVAGPRPIINEMAKLQQYSFVCAPSMAQAGLVGAYGVDMGPYVRAYERRRQMVEEALASVCELVHPGGAFYAFPRIAPPWPDAATFAERAIDRNCLLIPGSVFSRRDTHVRLSYAVAEDKLAEGLEVVRGLITQPP